MAFKSDVAAKQAFIQELNNRGFKAEVKAQPADILAEKDGETWYFEIKLTDHDDKCFGAATLTEWVQAFKTPERYRFVIAIRNEENQFKFIEYTPEEFMKFSTIPPFKVNFNIDFTDKVTKKKTTKGKKSALHLSEENFKKMNELYDSMKKEQTKSLES